MVNPINYYSHKLEHEIDSWDLRQAIHRGEPIVIIDARSAESYQQEHLPNAINIPHAKIDPKTTADFDNDTLHVTYCDGIGCNASTKGALRMSQLGFRVKELIGGIDWWKRDGHKTVPSVVQIESGEEAPNS